MRNPSHPGRVIRSLWLAGRDPAGTAGRLGLDPAEFTRPLRGECPLSPRVALRLEATGWSQAEFWMRLQAYYDLAQERLRNERSDPALTTPQAHSPGPTVAAN